MGGVEFNDEEVTKIVANTNGHERLYRATMGQIGLSSVMTSFGLDESAMDRLSPRGATELAKEIAGPIVTNETEARWMRRKEIFLGLGLEAVDDSGSEISASPTRRSVHARSRKPSDVWHSRFRLKPELPHSPETYALQVQEAIKDTVAAQLVYEKRSLLAKFKAQPK